MNSADRVLSALRFSRFRAHPIFATRRRRLTDAGAHAARALGGGQEQRRDQAGAPPAHRAGRPALGEWIWDKLVCPASQALSDGLELHVEKRRTHTVGLRAKLRTSLPRNTVSLSFTELLSSFILSKLLFRTK